jgi:glutaredoxin
MAAHVIVYTRAGCKLCEEAERLVAAHAGGATVELVDVDTDRELQDRYGVRVPVVAIDGVERFELQVDETELVAALRE